MSFLYITDEYYLNPRKDAGRVTFPGIVVRIWEGGINNQTNYTEMTMDIQTLVNGYFCQTMLIYITTGQ